MEPVLRLFVEFAEGKRRDTVEVQVQPGMSFTVALLQAQIATPTEKCKVIRLFLAEVAGRSYIEKHTLWNRSCSLNLSREGERWWKTFMRELQEQRGTK